MDKPDWKDAPEFANFLFQHKEDLEYVWVEAYADGAPAYDNKGTKFYCITEIPKYWKMLEVRP